jgi:7-cyano-7-deazaguanine tRNA-ribosyltransferase
MREQFEQRDGDGMARIGELTVPRAGVTVETPALMPVVNPNILTIEPGRLDDEFGAEVLITNSYIVRRNEDLRERAEREGLHAMLEFDGAIVTDSGSFQLAEYGEIDVTTREIVAFQREIGSDVATPVDVPTPPDVDRERAERELAETERALADAEAVEVGEMLLNAPVQGSTFLDLRERAARHAYGTSLDVFPVGAVVPLMNAYRYADVVDVVMAAKRGLGTDAPVHLFGAGHPSMFALAAATGCDLFDSAAYALYARDDRYLTVRGTEQLDDLAYLPCSCPVCTTRDPDELRALADDERERRLAEHNLHVSFEEIRRVKQAIRAGSLLELVEARARGHPALLDGYRTLVDYAEELETHDPASKATFFHLSGESARRPEVRRHHDRLPRLDVRQAGVDDVDDAVAGGADGDGTDGVGGTGETDETGDADDPDDWHLLCTEGGHPTEGFDAVWRLVPPFGPFPRALSETYPFTAEVPERRDRAAAEAAARGVARLAEANPDVRITVAHDGWPATALALLPDRVAVERVPGTEDGAGDDGAGERDRPDDPR